MLGLAINKGLSMSAPEIREEEAVFDPLSISALTEWFDYRTLSAAGDGNPVSSWAGRNGLYSLVQSGTARPAYAADEGDGKASVRFDGVNDSMTCVIDNSELYGADGEFECWFVIKGTPTANIVNDFFLTAGSPTVTFQAQPSQHRVNFYVSAQACYGNLKDVQDSEWHVIRIKRTAAGVDLFVDGASIGFNVFGSQAWSAGSGTAYLGGRENFWAGSFRHALFTSSPLDDDTAAQLTSYLTAA